MKNKHLKAQLAALALLAATSGIPQTAYVEFTHHVKNIHDAAARAANGHFAEADATPPAAHPHKE